MATFDDRASEWDSPERVERAREMADLVRSSVPLDTSMRMVEVGAGTGLLGLDLLDQVASVLLTDPSSGMLDIARSKIESGGVVGADTIVYDLPDDPPPGAPFDVAVSSLALHHIEDTEAALTSVRAMLRSGGWIAFIDLEAEDGSFHDDDAEGIHHHGFERHHLADGATEAGFTDVEVRPAGTIDRNEEEYPVLLLLGRC